MFEKVNPSHPDKIADRIAGAIVDLAYKMKKDPIIAVEVLIGHGKCTIIAEANVKPAQEDVEAAVHRIAGENVKVDYTVVEQDVQLAKNQEGKIRCGDNGIFKGTPLDKEEFALAMLVQDLYEEYPFDGKFIMSDDNLIMCQSNVSSSELRKNFPNAIVNPLGDWTGGIDVDCGATNRKLGSLGSDMGRAVTGGGLHGKDLSKADVAVNIYCHLLAEETKQPVTMYCAIGDETVNGVEYSKIIEIARKYIESVGGFEKFAEWGLVKL